MAMNGADTSALGAKRMSMWCRVAGIALVLTGMQCQAAEVVTYYYSNPQGTVLVRADQTGQVLSENDYRPYGGRVLGVSEHGPGYAGHVEDPESGLSYMQARYFDPDSGRFLSIDPTAAAPGNVFGVGRYSYANSNPIKNFDPNGRDSFVTLRVYAVRPNVHLPFGMGGNYDHAFVTVTNLDTRETVIARAGPDRNTYPNLNGLLNMAHYDRVKGSDGSSIKVPVTLVADRIRREAESDDNAREGVTTVPNSSVVVKGDTNELLKSIQGFNNALGAANIPYRALSQNSNSYAGTVYKMATGLAPPPPAEGDHLPGLKHDLMNEVCAGQATCGGK
jgi:RHS repeat-associated protein